MVAVLRVALVALVALAAPGCKKKGAAEGDLGECQAAVEHLREDCAIDFDAGSGSCTATDACIAGCIEDASCEALSGQDGAETQAFESCVEGCTSGVVDGPGCRPCNDYLDGLAAYEQLCSTSQQLAQGWASCLCDGACASPCYDSACMGVEGSGICAECVAEACAEPTDACRLDR